MNTDLSNHHIVVTGGAGALGTAVCRLLLDAGAKVSVPCFTEKEQESFELNSQGQVYTSAGIDLSNEQDTQSFYKTAINEQGDLWGSVHTAGGFGMGSIEDTSLEEFQKQLSMNTVTCYNACRAAVSRMRRSSHSGGRIVNVAARPALEPRQGKGMTAYTVSKAGVAALTEALAAEVVGDNILVNAVAPSVIDTPANRNSMPEANHGRWPKPQEIASQILCLVSPENEVTRGAVISVYGKS